MTVVAKPGKGGIVVKSEENKKVKSVKEPLLAESSDGKEPVREEEEELKGAEFMSCRFSENYLLFSVPLAKPRLIFIFLKYIKCGSKTLW